MAVFDPNQTSTTDCYPVVHSNDGAIDIPGGVTEDAFTAQAKRRSPIMQPADPNWEASGNRAGGFPSTQERKRHSQTDRSSAQQLRQLLGSAATGRTTVFGYMPLSIEDIVPSREGNRLTHNSRYACFLLRIRICRCRFSNPLVAESPQLCPNVQRVYCFARGISHRRRHASLRSYPH